MLRLIQKAEEKHILSKNELIEILANEEFDKDVFAAADRVRKKYVGDDIHLRALIEFSNTLCIGFSLFIVFRSFCLCFGW